MPTILLQLGACSRASAPTVLARGLGVHGLGQLVGSLGYFFLGSLDKPPSPFQGFPILV